MNVRQSIPRGRRAAAAVELAITAAPLVLLIAIALDFARVYRAHVILTDCARSGALYLADPVAAQSSRYADYTAAALADSYGSDGSTSLLSPALTTSNISSATGTDADGNPSATVTVTYDFPLLLNYVVPSGVVTITRSVQVRVAPTLPNFS